jgi:purine-binding chemotaxis protein CheW
MLQRSETESMNTSASSETYILFEISGTTYAVHSAQVQQIEMVAHITPLPNAPPFIDGVVFTRGQVIPAMNLRVRFGFERASSTVRSRLIVVQYENRLIGLIVDSAREFMSIPPETIRPPHESLSNVSGQYLKGTVTIEERIVLIVDIAELTRMAQIPEELHARA